MMDEKLKTIGAVPEDLIKRWLLKLYNGPGFSHLRMCVVTSGHKSAAMSF